MMTNAAPSFRIFCPRALRREGFNGPYVTVVISSEGLALKGDQAGSVHVSWSQVERARIGFTEGKYGPIYEARLWVSGWPISLAIFPDREGRSAYAEGMRTLVGQMQSLGHLKRVSAGTSPFEAILGPALMAIVSAAAIAAAAFAMEPPEWWHFVVIPFFPVLITAYLIWRAVTVHWPRPLEAVRDIERELPQ